MSGDDRPATLAPDDECARLVLRIWPHMARLTPAAFCRHYLARIEYDEWTGQARIIDAERRAAFSLVFGELAKRDQSSAAFLALLRDRAETANDPQVRGVCDDVAQTWAHPWLRSAWGGRMPDWRRTLEGGEGPGTATALPLPPWAATEAKARPVGRGQPSPEPA